MSSHITPLPADEASLEPTNTIAVTVFGSFLPASSSGTESVVWFRKFGAPEILRLVPVPLADTIRYCVYGTPGASGQSHDLLIRENTQQGQRLPVNGGGTGAGAVAPELFFQFTAPISLPVSGLSAGTIGLPSVAPPIARQFAGARGRCIGGSLRMSSDAQNASGTVSGTLTAAIVASLRGLDLTSAREVASRSQFVKDAVTNADLSRGVVIEASVPYGPLRSLNTYSKPSLQYGWETSLLFTYPSTPAIADSTAGVNSIWISPYATLSPVPFNPTTFFNPNSVQQVGARPLHPGLFSLPELTCYVGTTMTGAGNTWGPTGTPAINGVLAFSVTCVHTFGEVRDVGGVPVPHVISSITTVHSEVRHAGCFLGPFLFPSSAHPVQVERGIGVWLGCLVTVNCYPLATITSPPTMRLSILARYPDDDPYATDIGIFTYANLASGAAMNLSGTLIYQVAGADLTPVAAHTTLIDANPADKYELAAQTLSSSKDARPLVYPTRDGPDTNSRVQGEYKKRYRDQQYTTTQ